MEQSTKDIENDNLCENEKVNNIVEKVAKQESVETNINDKNNNENNAEQVENDNEKNSNQLENTSEENSKKNLKFWVGLTSAAIILGQFICYYFLGQEIEIKLVIEFISLILAVLVFVGIIKSDNTSNNIEEIKDDISNSITEQLDTLKQKKNKKD